MAEYRPKIIRLSAAPSSCAVITPEKEVDETVPELENVDHEEAIKTPEKENMYMCNICDFTTKYRSCLRRHYIIHNPSQKVKCGECDREFQTKSGLKLHLKGHAGEFACCSCGKILRSLPGVKEHEKYCSRSAPKPYLCTDCGLAFVRQ